jgi:hypothetical protein
MPIGTSWSDSSTDILRRISAMRYYPGGSVVGVVNRFFTDTARAKHDWMIGVVNLDPDEAFILG